MSKPYTRPRLMFVIGMRSTKIGGMEKFLRLLAVEMGAAGWETVLCFDGEPSAQLKEYLQLPFLTLESVAEQDGLGVGAAKDLWRLLRKHRPQVFAYAFNSVMRVFPVIAKTAGAKRIYFNDHSSRAQGVVAAPLAIHKRIVGRILTSPLTGIISVADFTRRSGAAFGLSRAPNIVVRNGIELLVPDKSLGQTFRRQHGIPSDAIVVTIICWMVPIKGVEVLLEAARGLLARHPQLHFMMVGGGEMLEEYRKTAAQMVDADRIHFPGIVNEPVKAGVLDAADIYCQPSLWQEAAPLAVLEAMSKSLPVVASRTGGLPEMVLHDVTGVLVPSGDARELEHQLELLIDDQELRHRLGTAGRNRVEAEHRLEDMVARYISVFTGARSLQDAEAARQ
jgi:glycosyltransferase involved in cell wall biosynthesis